MHASSRLVVVRNQHAEIILDSRPPEELPPLAADAVGHTSEPTHIGSSFKAAAPVRSIEAEHPWLMAAFYIVCFMIGMAGVAIFYPVPGVK